MEFVEEFIPRLEHANFVYRYSWFYTRYYEDHNHEGWFWIDSDNSLLEAESPELSIVGKAYDKPWHMDEFKPKNPDYVDFSTL